MPEDAIDRSLQAIDRGESAPSTMREGRKEFGARGDIVRPDDMPQSGRTMIERLTSYFGRKPRRDTGRTESR